MSRKGKGKTTGDSAGVAGTASFQGESTTGAMPDQGEPAGVAQMPEASAVGSITTLGSKPPVFDGSGDFGVVAVNAPEVPAGEFAAVLHPDGSNMLITGQRLMAEHPGGVLTQDEVAALARKAGEPTVFGAIPNSEVAKAIEEFHEPRVMPILPVIDAAGEANIALAKDMNALVDKVAGVPTVRCIEVRRVVEPNVVRYARFDDFFTCGTLIWGAAVDRPTREVMTWSELREWA